MTYGLAPWEVTAPIYGPAPWDAQPETPEEYRLRFKEKLRDFDEYRKHLRIRPREGGARVPFRLNEAQTVLHHRLKQELDEFGRIRALVPKARRMGVSTYVGSRFFHQTATQFGRRSQVVAHRTDSASNLHKEIKEFCAGLPSFLRPSVGATNARELIFEKLKSLYKVASAEGGEIGRSDDFHALHLSEAAFMEAVEDLSSGLLQTVQDLPGTEIVMESTGNGPTGMFHSMCEQASKEGNKGLWRLHFLPWTIMSEYRLRVPQGWAAPREFEDYARMHGLTREQLYFYWTKNYTLATMNGGTPDTIHRLTRQEYPATYSECFMSDSTLAYFPPSLVAAAMGRPPRPNAYARKLLCVDASGDGQDPTMVADRQGSAIGARIWGAIPTKDANVASDWLTQQFRTYNMDALLVDCTGGYGRELVSGCRLRMPEIDETRIVPVVFSYGATNGLLYGNKRSELHGRFLEWLAQPDASIPKNEHLSEACAAYKWGQGDCRRDEKGRLFMTPKEKIRAALPANRSPDELDVCAISMAVLP